MDDLSDLSLLEESYGLGFLTHIIKKIKLNITNISRNLSESDALLLHQCIREITPVCPYRIVWLGFRDGREKFSVEYRDTLSFKVEIVISILTASEPIWMIDEWSIEQVTACLGVADIGSYIQSSCFRREESTLCHEWRTKCEVLKVTTGSLGLPISLDHSPHPLCCDSFSIFLCLDEDEFSIPSISFV